MTEMWNPNNPAHVGPQVTARPGTKRHLRQTIARANFFAIHYVTARAVTLRAEQALDDHMSKMLNVLPSSGSA